MRIKRKILSVPAGDADRRPLRELHQGKRETANTATSGQDTRGCQATFFRAEKRVTPRWAGGWTRALKVVQPPRAASGRPSCRSSGSERGEPPLGPSSGEGWGADETPRKTRRQAPGGPDT